MPRVLFIWNTAGKDGNIGSYRPSVYAAKSIGYDIDIAMNFCETPIEKQKELEKKLDIRLIHIDIDRNPYSIRNYKAYKQLVKIMKGNQYDIIHCNTPMGSILGRLAAKTVNHHRVFYMNRGFAFYKGAPLKNWIIYYNIEKFFARFFTDAIGTINPIDYEVADKFRLRNGSGLKFSIPGPGVELSRFQYSEGVRRHIREQYGIKKQDIVVLSVGEITKRKNFESIVESIGIIYDKKLLNNDKGDIYYMIVGEGPMRNQLLDKARHFGIQDKVIFTGFFEKVAQFYSAADIFALPSLSEGFGRVGIEAMRVGLPLLTSNVQGINLYSINGKTGFKYNPKDISGYMEGILKLVGDSEMRAQIGEYNRNFSKHFSLENSAEIIAEIYEKLMCL